MVKDILTQLGTSAVVIAITAYFAKTWLKHQLDRVEKQNSHELAKQIARLNIHEPYLHKRRVDLIEAMYSKMIDAEFSLQSFLINWWAHSNREETIDRGFPIQGEFSIKRGLEFCEAYAEINAMFHKNALYFDESFIEQITKAYKPHFDMILSIGESEPPEFPNEYKDIVTVGQTPRKSMITLFRRTLGVESNG